VDVNGDGLVDCTDLDTTPEPEPDPDPEPETPCPIPDVYVAAFQLVARLLDSDADGGVTLDEIATVFPDISQYTEYFAAADANEDGKIDLTELMLLRPFLASLIGMDPVAYVDPDGDRLIAWEEVASLVDASIFSFLDRNANGVIDCDDLAQVIGPPVPIDPGEPPIPGEPCPLPVEEVIAAVMEYADANGDGKVCMDEIGVLLPPVMDPDDPHILKDSIGVMPLPSPIDLLGTLFNLMDANGDGCVDKAELKGAISAIDRNGDLVITPDEMPIPGVFPYLDRNGDGVIDCRDIPEIVIDPIDPGDPPVAVEPCPLPVDDVIAKVMLYGDTNGDGKVCLDEVIAQLPPITIMGSKDIGTAIYPSPNDLLVMLFNELDQNGDQCVDAAELKGAISAMDRNGDLVITPDEVPISGVFPYLDRNGDGVIDCRDVPEIVIGPIDPGDGEEPGDGEPGDPGNGEEPGDEEPGDPAAPPVIGPVPVDMARLLSRLFNVADSSGNGALEFGEILSRVNVPVPVLEAMDLNNDGAVDVREFGQILTAAASNVEQVLQVLREVRGAYSGRFYRPGEAVEVVIRITRRLAQTVQGLTLEELLPEGWTLGAVKDSSGKALVEKAEGNVLRLNWPADVTFPLEVRYTMVAPSSGRARFALVGELLYNVAGSVLSASVPPAVVAEALDTALCHTADTNRDWRISLSEVLRAVQLFNSGGYGAAEHTEDGYLPGGMNRNGTPHRGDLNGNWQFELSELLRIIQLYNTDGGWYYAENGTEDGFLAGLL